MPEVIVATGTALLALATAWLSWQTRRSVQQALLARLDQMGPAVLIVGATLDDTAFAKNAVGAGYHSLPAGVAWPVSQFGHEPLGIGCVIEAVNEGSRSAMVRFVLPGDAYEVQTLVPPFDADGLPGLDLPVRADWTIITPGKTATFHVTYWQLASEWARLAENVRRGATAAEQSFSIEVKAEPAAILDRCRIRFRKLALWTDPTGNLTVASSDPTGQPRPYPEVLLEVGDMTRQYPGRRIRACAGSPV